MSTFFYGVWDNDANDWIHATDAPEALLVWTSKRAACQWAANNWGFRTYTETKRNGWCDVRLINKAEAK
jgi:hypothetical protein